MSMFVSRESEEELGRLLCNGWLCRVAIGMLVRREGESKCLKFLFVMIMFLEVSVCVCGLVCVCEKERRREETKSLED